MYYPVTIIVIIQLKLSEAKSLANYFPLLIVEIEKYLKEFTKTLILKSAAKDILEDLKTIDLQNDKEWQTARNLAWQQEKHQHTVFKMIELVTDEIRKK